MGNKVDMEEVVALSNNLERAAEEIKERLKSVESSIDSLIGRSSFTGETATAAKKYFQDLHITVLTTFYNLFTDLNENLKQHIQSFQSDVDSSESALIKSNYLKDIESDVKDHYDDLLFEWERAGEIPVFDYIINGTPSNHQVVQKAMERVEN